MLVIGELRYSSAGNVYRLERFDGRNLCGVRRVGLIGTENDRADLWDYSIVYSWDYCQWDSLPLLGERSTEPSFGIFAPVGAT